MCVCLFVRNYTRPSHLHQRVIKLVRRNTTSAAETHSINMNSVQSTGGGGGGGMSKKDSQIEVGNTRISISRSVCMHATNHEHGTNSDTICKFPNTRAKYGVRSFSNNIMLNFYFGSIQIYKSFLYLLSNMCRRFVAFISPSHG